MRKTRKRGGDIPECIESEKQLQKYTERLETLQGMLTGSATISPNDKARLNKDMEHVSKKIDKHTAILEKCSADKKTKYTGIWGLLGYGGKRTNRKRTHRKRRA
jgi:hypothetical protein|uniref:Uncharacterized protein n=1 Tax=viral metagenome TaxID=1070528 RepID=A0A6C0IIG2_9ZZZZ